MNYCCAFTGHREINSAQLEYVRNEIRREILAAIADGYTHFLCGMASGADLIFASVIVELKRTYPMILEADLPYPKRTNTPDPEFQNLIRRCDVINVHSKFYFPGCFAIRNEYMVQKSSRLIAVFDGRKKTGTAATIRYAKLRNLDIRIISINN